MTSDPPSQNAATSQPPSSTREKQKTRLLVALGIIAALLLLCFARMAFYHYHTANLGMLGPQLLRYDRLTGQTGLYCKGHGWQKIEVSGDSVTLPGGTEVFIGSQGTPLDIVLRWVAGITFLGVAGVEIALLRSRSAQRKRRASTTVPA